MRTIQKFIPSSEIGLPYAEGEIVAEEGKTYKNGDKVKIRVRNTLDQNSKKRHLGLRIIGATHTGSGRIHVLVTAVLGFLYQNNGPSMEISTTLRIPARINPTEEGNELYLLNLGLLDPTPNEGFYQQRTSMSYRLKPIPPEDMEIDQALDDFDGKMSCCIGEGIRKIFSEGEFREFLNKHDPVVSAETTTGVRPLDQVET